MVNLLGVTIDELSHAEIFSQINSASLPLVIASINPEILLYAWYHNEYRNIVNQASLKIVDGIGVVIMARLLYGVKLSRFPGADLAEEIVKYAVATNKKIFLLGGTQKTNKQAVLWLTSKFHILNSNIKRLGGNFTEQEAVQAINDYKPDIVFVALGGPKQELFIYKFLTSRFQIPNSILMGIGGAIDFWAKPNLRAPYILRHVGLEWLWRLIRQPWRLTRIFRAAILFPAACLKERILLK